MYDSFANSGERGFRIGEMAKRVPGGGMGVGDMFAIATSLGAEEVEDPWPLVDRLREGIEDIEGQELLPGTLGGYIARAEREDVLADNPQLRGASPGERERFVCRKVRESLRERIAAEADLDRQRALMAARDLACDAPQDDKAELTEREARPLIERYYERQGEWAGQYEIVGMDRIRLVERAPDHVEAHVAYRFDCRIDHCGGSEQRGRDRRVFHLRAKDGRWRVTRMGRHRSARFGGG